MKPLSRREALLSVGLGASLVSHVAGNRPGTAEAGMGSQPPRWIYNRVAPADAATEAYGLYPSGGCMYGVFKGVMDRLAVKGGEPFRSFPCQMMKYGEGGGAGWGSLCGALNGAAAMIGLFIDDKERREAVLAELFHWYEDTPLPAYRPTGAGEELEQTTAHSVLCHVSSVRWCEATGSPAVSPERKERCRRLTADVAAKTIELLNRHADAEAHFAGLSTHVQSCVDCHGKKDLNQTAVKMDCDTCHDLPAKHPQEKANGKQAAQKR